MACFGILRGQLLFKFFGVLFLPMMSRWAGGQWEKVCPGCISETM